MPSTSATRARANEAMVVETTSGTPRASTPPRSYVKPSMRKAMTQSSIASILLWLMIIIISVGPRISVGGSAEIRLQDLFILPVMFYLLLSQKPMILFPVYRLLGFALPVFLWASIVVVTVAIWAEQEIPMLVRVAFYGRILEMFFLAVVIAGLYLRSGSIAQPTVINAVAFGALANIMWVGYQMSAGEHQTLLGRVVSEGVESYGPMLIGEPSAFGVGQYWAFVASVAAALIKAGHKPVWNTLLFTLALAGAYLAESRVSMGGIIVIAGLLLIMGKRRGQLFNVLGSMVGLAFVVCGMVFILPLIGGRVSADAVQASFDIRIDQIWRPMWDLVAASPWVGIGPGGLEAEWLRLPFDEAHNIALRAVLDFGIPVGVMFILLFLLAMSRAFRVARSKRIDQDTRITAYIAAFYVLSVLIAGCVQDSLTGVMSAHLTMVAVGLFAAQHARWRDCRSLSEE